MGIRLEQITLREIRMPLVHFFETSFDRITARRIVLVEVQSGGVSGWGEVTAGENPFYNEEWSESAWLILRDFVAPRVLNHTFECAAEVGARSAHIRGHLMARGGLEAAVWDLEARMLGKPLYQHIGRGAPAAKPNEGPARREIPCGVSIGIQDSVEQLFGKIEAELAAGYQRIKMKIKPGWDMEVVGQVRKRFPGILLMADANSAYTLADAPRLKHLDEFNLMMIEQPLAHDEIIDHAKLQAQLKTPICLDECIRSSHQAEQAIAMDAGRIINIKLGRVGGFAEARRVHDVAQKAGVPVWCGGMLESGIGRAHNIALATLPNFTLPGDVSASRRYWARDIIDPPVEVSARGTIAVRDDPGFGYQLDREFLDSITIRLDSLS
jgi:O-succinylbenzoate synthase